MAKKETTNSVKPPAQEPEPFPVFDPAEFLAVSNRNLEIATRATSAYLGGAARVNKEIADFVTARVRKDIKTAQDIMSARDSGQAYRCQAEFFNAAIRDYAEETARVMNIVAEIANASLAPVEERTAEVLHYIGERAEQRPAAAAE